MGIRPFVEQDANEPLHLSIDPRGIGRRGLVPDAQPSEHPLETPRLEDPGVVRHHRPDTNAHPPVVAQRREQEGRRALLPLVLLRLHVDQEAVAVFRSNNPVVASPGGRLASLPGAPAVQIEQASWYPRATATWRSGSRGARMGAWALKAKRRFIPRAFSILTVPSERPNRGGRWRGRANVLALFDFARLHTPRSLLGAESWHRAPAGHPFFRVALEPLVGGSWADALGSAPPLPEGLRG